MTSDIEVFNRGLNKIRNETRFRKCFKNGCRSSPIRAHSISKSKHLAKISENGQVMFFNTNLDEFGKSWLKKTGKAKASTFPGFCDRHDKAFEPVDNTNYTPGNKEQEFLFAYRALAMEYSAKGSAVAVVRKMISLASAGGNEFKAYFPHQEPSQLNMELSGYLAAFLIGSENALSNLEKLRTAFNINLTKKRFYKVVTKTFALDQEYPIVCSSAFNIDKDFEGRLVNDLSDLSRRPKPTFLTIFPQRRRTFVLLGSLKNHAGEFGFLDNLNCSEQDYVKVVFSNLLATYVENFAVRPSYWGILPKETRDAFYQLWRSTTLKSSPSPMIADSQLNLFAR